ncbi:MAG: mechanosensitive ion channel [Pseudomonadota bacterium]|nr:mechanosensitive ion channel [Pseudomonadota bacterium]
MKTIIKALFALFVITLMMPVNVCLAGDSEEEFSTDEISTLLYKIEAVIEDKRSLLSHLDEYLKKLPDYTALADKCITTTTDKLTDLGKHLEKLGEAADGEPSDVAFTRDSLTVEKTDLENRQSSCKAILVRSETAIKNISQFRKKNLERKSFDRGDSILTVFHTIRSVPDLTETRVAKLLGSSSGVNVLNSSQWIMLLSILIIVTAIARYIRSLLSRWDSKSLIRWQQQHLDETDTGTRFVAALLMTIRRYVLPVLISTSIAIFIAIETYDLQPTPLITIITYDLPLLILAFALIYFTFIALPALGLREDIDKKVLNSLRFRLAILAIVIYLGNLLFQGILTHSLAEETFFLARAFLALILVLNVIWVLWLTHNIKGVGLSTQARVLTSMVLIAALIAELTGYRNLAGYIIRGVIGSLVAYTLFQLFSSLLKNFLEELNTGESNWQRRLRRSVGVKDNEVIHGFIWVRIVAIGALWLLFIVSLLYIWGVPILDIRMFTSTFMQGFTIASFKIVPVKIFEAIVVLIVLLSLNGWFQKSFSKKFLAKVGIERGARESISTISNYLGITLVIIISLAVVGMDFSKLAIIAGALSVGIGFGLQNVVNNFVSGLILLFERPIKTGDWIVAGGSEGTVKKISIRSTQIQSFDGADIIIPNAELISGTLINWELKQRHGRVRVPIGVAYGSDTAMVKEILLKAATKHSDTINKSYTISDPQVMFLSFGDSSLNFELRFFIKDIKKRVSVLSDLNFAIDAAFRENGIEIPFPQRDVHIRGEKTDTKLIKDDRPDEPGQNESSTD